MFSLGFKCCFRQNIFVIFLKLYIYIHSHHIAVLFFNLFVCFMIITCMALNSFHLSTSYTLYHQPHRTTQNLLTGTYKFTHKLICLAFGHYLCILISHYRFILKYYVSLLCFRYILIRFLAFHIQYPYVYNPTLHYLLYYVYFI